MASGSSGNCLLIQHEERAIIIDAGLSARKLAAALAERGIRPGGLEAILITHEHTDHATGADLISKRFGAPVVCNRATLTEIERRSAFLESRVLPTGESLSAGAFEVSSFPVAHDAAEPVGYMVQCAGYRVMIATDLGCATPELRFPVERCDLVVLEANHDVEQLLDGPYPQYLKRRILSDRGHLSNAQAAELIASALSSRPQTFWLAHLSRKNNSKKKARDGVMGYLAKEGLAPRVLVTDRDKPSLVWEPSDTAVQLSLFGAAPA